MFGNLKQSLIKQSSLDEQEQMTMEMESQQQENEEEISDDYRPCGNIGSNDVLPPPNENNSENDEINMGGENLNTTLHGISSPTNEPQRPDGQYLIHLKLFFIFFFLHFNNIFTDLCLASRLPWAPKVRQKDIDQFLYDSRNKFIGYSFVGDHDSLAGLPQPIHEGFNVLKKVSFL